MEKKLQKNKLGYLQSKIVGTYPQL